MNFIALYATSGHYGQGNTPDAAYKKLVENVRNDTGDDVELSGVEMFEVKRKGKPSITVEWSA